ncbi:MAG: molybdopterin molybdotransferase MoeA [Deltaproteobacteria bacterium]|nr:molybdopterin molybdotransferase MoeA [Deltaproteobacteria bacterium]
MISVEDAIGRILEQIPRLGKERVNILDSRGRVLAEEIEASMDIPPWNNAAMDGYAVRWADIRQASPKKPVRLKVLADLPAGSVFQGRLHSGEAVRIMTGAPLPQGADTVVQVESTEKIAARVKILDVPARGGNVRRAGEDVRKGQKVLREGEILRPAHIGMLSSLKRAFVSVYQRPRVAILSTGDELLEIDEPWAEGKIINSNSYTLAALVSENGGVPLQLGIAKDRREDLAQKIRAGLVADLLLTSGGVSMGDYDLVKEILHDLGQMSFWKVAMRPGQPLAFGRVEGKPLFGLPGNPVSAMVSFEQFVRPAIRKMSGHLHLFRLALRAVLGETLGKKATHTYFLRCRLSWENGKILASTTGEQGSAILSSMIKAQGLIVLPPGQTLAHAGQEVKVLLLDPEFAHTPLPTYLGKEGGPKGD